MDSFVYTTDKNGDIQAGGYKINNELLTNTLKGGGVVADMIVPAGLFLSKKILEKNKNIMSKIEDNNEVIGEDLYSKLLNLVQPTLKTRKKTRKKKKTTSKKNISRRKR